MAKSTKKSSKSKPSAKSAKVAPKKTTAKPISKSAAKSKPAAKAKKLTAKPKAKPKAKPAAKSNAKAATKPAAKKAVKAVAKKVVATAPAKKTSQSKQNSSSSSNSKTTGSKIAVGVVAAGAVAAGAAGAAAAIGAANRAKRNETPIKYSGKPDTRQKMSINKNPQEIAPGGGIIKPATKSAPAMRLSVNDSEVLANAKERYGTKDLEMFRKLIVDQRQEAKEEFDILSQNILDTSGEFEADNQAYSLHSAEQGTDAIEREKTFLHAQRTSDYIKKLDEALERIDRGTYGICVICGTLIEKQRLGAVPITQKHVDCKNKTQAKKLSVEQAFRDLEDPMATME